MVLRVLNQQRSLLQSLSGDDVSKHVLMQKRLSIKSSKIALHALQQNQSTLSSSSFMVTMKMEMETDQNGAE